MQNRLQACSEYLKEVEGKLIHLRNTIGDDDSEAKTKVIEAIGFIEQAHRAVSQTNTVSASCSMSTIIALNGNQPNGALKLKANGPFRKYRG